MVDHHVTTLVSLLDCGVNRMVIVILGNSTEHTAHTAYLVSLDSPLSVLHGHKVYNLYTAKTK